MSDQPIHRDRSLDFLRGTSILFMIMTHAIGVFYSGSNIIIEKISWWGGTVCFTIFLFVFGAVYGLKLYKGELQVKHEVTRGIITLFAYYFITLWVYVFGVWKFGEITSQFWSDIVGILTLEKLMFFTEFVIAFVFYIFIIVLFQKRLRILVKKPFYALAGSLGLFLLGRYLYITLPWDAGILAIIKTHLVGKGDIHSFPILSYAPVVIPGLVWGYWLRVEHFKKTYWLRMVSGLMVGAFAALCVTRVFPPDRFPPSIFFLSYGMTYSVLILLIFPVIERLRALERPVFFVGKHGFSFYFLHIIFMIPLGWWFETGSPNIFRLVFLFSVIILAISGVITVKKGLRFH